MPPLTLVHIVISLFAIVVGIVVIVGLLTANLLERWTRVFFGSTLATSVTGFAFFPLQPVLPAHIVGIISLGVLAIGLFALYGRRLAGKWRPTYVISVVLALYFNVFVLIVQSFMKIPGLRLLAPTQSEPPFAVAQLGVLAAFAVVTALALMRFHPARARAAGASAQQSSFVA